MESSNPDGFTAIAFHGAAAKDIPERKK